MRNISRRPGKNMYSQGKRESRREPSNSFVCNDAVMEAKAKNRVSGGFSRRAKLQAQGNVGDPTDARLAWHIFARKTSTTTADDGRLRAAYHGQNNSTEHDRYICTQPVCQRGTCTARVVALLSCICCVVLVKDAWLG